MFNLRLNNKFLTSFIFVSFLLIANGVQRDYCDLKCKSGNQIFTHTVCQRTKDKCGPHQRCGSEFQVIKIDDKMKHFIVNLHNDLRNKVASGNETRGLQPSAMNMKVMTYDSELEYIAQCWANTCNASPLKHDKCRRTRFFDHIGQNLAYVKSTALNIGLKYAIETMIMHWYDEVAIFDSEWVKSTQPRGSIKVGHYTQMVWADTNRIGCGLSFYTKTSQKTNRKWYHYFLVCNYGPGGNYIGLPVYKEGPSCKACKNGVCNKKYSSLCD
ncbi:venom allergen 3-like [Onthophagus taurus]|uniref:venom allergen 3-like n=1 Tax=Onthophagus taurus TaxID=166361 RepID=UPI0039BDD03E